MTITVIILIVINSQDNKRNDNDNVDENDALNNDNKKHLKNRV